MRDRAGNEQPATQVELVASRGTSSRPAQWDSWAPSDCWASAFHRFGKRAADLAAASAGLLLLLPVTLVVAVLIRFSSRGPIVLGQTRIGKGGRPFTMYKFRTMYSNSDSAIHQKYYRNLVSGSAERVNGAFKLANDSRMTLVGRFLRRISLDELLQLFNVLKGDMSLVGPRPPLPYEVEMYDERSRLRLSITPGLTGLWQVSGRNTLDFHQMIDLDLEYIAGWSFWLDLRILLQTPVVVVTGRGAH